MRPVGLVTSTSARQKKKKGDLTKKPYFDNSFKNAPK